MSLLDKLALKTLPEPLYTFGFTYNLMRAFINHTEETINVSIATYKATGPSTEEIEICSEEGIYQHAYHHHGLYEHSNDVILDNIVESYFPSLQRRSALLTLIATYEHELEKFCYFYSEKNETPVKLNDLKGSGLERVHLFMIKLIGLKNSQSFSMIKKLIRLRNSCAHNDAKLTTNDGQEIAAIRTLIDDSSIKVRQDGQHVFIEEGFLSDVLEELNTYISEIQEVIEKGKE
ncbi:TPA: hypothetical protein ACX6R4_002172 [Photobacterium damselae]|uniref:hypothetical protein n=1 Tax=Photobacterium damselae TaxID=38293 RepID=UPI002090363B|nr:hypothetical protein [Photobacterium damselae]USR75588.1 hypothetical protein NGM67_00830 [Photobacterium damselae]